MTRRVMRPTECLRTLVGLAVTRRGATHTTAARSCSLSGRVPMCLPLDPHTRYIQAVFRLLPLPAIPMLSQIVEEREELGGVRLPDITDREERVAAGQRHPV